MQYTVFLLANGKMVPGIYAAILELLNHRPEYRVVAKLKIYRHHFVTLANGEQVKVKGAKPLPPGGVKFGGGPEGTNKEFEGGGFIVNKGTGKTKYR